jgi:3-phenylpropionate/cinnamic acid dioxygenase small subunit
MTLVAKDAPLLYIPAEVLRSAAIQLEVEQFLYFEAELLDNRRFADWYLLCAEDIHYWMPTRRNRTSRELDRENATRGEASHFDENKRSLGWRVAQLATGKHWAEDPPSRTRHLVTNVRIENNGGGNEFSVRSNFICYKNRLEDEVDIWAGERQDVLRLIEPGAWQIARRRILLDQNVVLSKNLSVFL